MPGWEIFSSCLPKVLLTLSTRTLLLVALLRIFSILERFLQQSKNMGIGRTSINPLALRRVTTTPLSGEGNQGPREGPSFADVLRKTTTSESKPAVVQVKSGDTLSGLVQDFLMEKSGDPSNAEIYKGVWAVAQANGMSNPDRIRAGSQIDLSVLDAASPHTQKQSNVTRDLATVLEVSLPVIGEITSTFGLRADPFTHQVSVHNGIDIAAPKGTPIQAASDGRVVFSGWKSGYGNVVEIDHGKGYRSLYAHAEKNLVHAGDVVRAGQTVSLVGSSGRSTGNHVHFELRKNDKPVNPQNNLLSTFSSERHLALNSKPISSTQNRS